MDRLKKQEETRNMPKLSGNHLKHLTVYPNEVVKTLLGAVDSNVAPTFDRVRINHRRRTSSRKAQLALRMLLQLNALQVKFVTVAVVSTQLLQNSYHAVIYDHCASIVEEELCRCTVAEGFETSNQIRNMSSHSLR